MKSHPLRVEVGGSPSSGLGKTEAPRPRLPLGFSILAGKGRGNAQRSVLGTRVISIATTPPRPPPPVISGKMGVARSTGGTLLPPPYILSPGEATGHEAERGSACALSPPPPRGRW